MTTETCEYPTDCCVTGPHTHDRHGWALPGTLAFSPLTGTGLLDIAMSQRGMVALAMMDAERYLRSGDEDIIPLAQDDARRYARTALDMETAQDNRRAWDQ